MTTGLRVVFIPVRGFTIWQEAFQKVLPSKHRLTTLNSEADLESQLSDADVVVDLGGWGTRSMMDAARNVRLWQILGTGFDHFDLAYASKRLVVANCPGQTSAIALAECAVMHMLMLVRRPRRSEELMRNGRMWEPFGGELCGKLLLIVGFGASGRALAVRAHAFGMQVHALDVEPISTRHGEGRVLSFAGHIDHLDSQLQSADFVSLHVPLNSGTRHLLDGRRIALMHPGARIINMARGALVDENALLEALSNATLAGAGLDVFGSEPPDPGSGLLNHPKVTLTGHIAGLTRETADRRAQMAVENIHRLEEGRRLLAIIGQPA